MPLPRKPVLPFPLVLAVAFLLGCLPSGRLIAHLYLGRRAGLLRNGGLGATSVARQVGTGAGALVFLLDVSKGALPVLWARRAGLSTDRRGLLSLAPLLGNVTANHARGAATGAGAALADDPEALALVTPVLSGGFMLRRHPQSALLGYLMLPPARYLLGRRRPAAWTAASMALLILARARGTGPAPFGGPGETLPRGQVLKERIWYDREPA